MNQIIFALYKSFWIIFRNATFSHHGTFVPQFPSFLLWYFILILTSKGGGHSIDLRLQRGAAWIYLWFWGALQDGFVSLGDIWSDLWKMACSNVLLTMAWPPHSPLILLRLHTRIIVHAQQLLCSSLMEIQKPGCPGNVESEETSLSWLYTRSIGSQWKIKDQR